MTQNWHEANTIRWLHFAGSSYIVLKPIKILCEAFKYGRKFSEIYYKKEEEKIEDGFRRKQDRQAPRKLLFAPVHTLQVQRSNCDCCMANFWITLSFALELRLTPQLPAFLFDWWIEKQNKNKSKSKSKSDAAFSSSKYEIIILFFCFVIGFPFFNI